MRRFTSNGPDQCKNGSSNLLTPDQERPRSIRIVATYPRPAFSVTKRTNCAPISLINNPKFLKATRHAEKYNLWNTEVYGDGGFELVKPARESASSRPKPCASLKIAPRVLPVRRSLLVLVGRKQIVVRDQLFLQKRPGSRL